MGILSVLGSPRPAGTPVGSATSITTTQLPPEFRPFITDIFQKAKAQQEGLKFIPFTGPRIRGFGPLQEEAFTGLTDLARRGISSVPDATSATFLTAATDAAARAGRPITTEDIARLSSPFQQEVIDVAKREAQRDFDLQVAPKVAAEAAAAGSFGGSRAGLLESESLRNLQEQLSDIQTKGSAQAFAQAQQAFQDERAAAAGLSGFLERQMTGVPNQALKELAALQTVGESKQLLDQKALDLAYQDFLEEREFPTRSLQEYQASIRGFPYTPAAYQYTTQTAPTPSLGQTLLTAAAQGAGLYGTLGGFGFGGTQKAASGGQIRGGLSGMVESHQNNKSLPKQQYRVPRKFTRGWKYAAPRRNLFHLTDTPETERFEEVEEFTSRDLLPWQQSARIAKLAQLGNLSADKMEQLNVEGVSSIDESDIGPGRGVSSALAQVSPVALKTAEVEEAKKRQARWNPLDILLGKPVDQKLSDVMGIGTPRQAYDDVLAGEKEGIATYKKSLEAAETKDAAELAASELAERATLKGLAEKSKFTKEQLENLKQRQARRKSRYGTEKTELEDFRTDIQSQDREAVEELREGAEDAQTMYDEQIGSLQKQRGFEILAAFGATGQVSAEEASRGSIIETAGRIMADASRAMAPQLRELSEKERKAEMAKIERAGLDKKEIRNLNRAATLRDKDAFKELSQFETNYENDLMKYRQAKEALRTTQIMEPAERAKAQIAVKTVQAEIAQRDVVRQQALAKLQSAAEKAATEAEGNRAEIWIKIYKQLADNAANTMTNVEAADYNVLLKQVSGATPGRFTIVDGQLRNLDGSAFDADTESKHADAYTSAMRIFQVTGDMPLALETYIEKARASGIMQPSAVSGGPPPNAIKSFRDAVKNDPNNRERHIKDFRIKYNLTEEEAEGQL